MIIRAKRPTNFTIISNVGMNDERLSFKARGILAYLLTKPDHWQVSDRHLSTVGPDGRSAVQAALKELEKAGYLRRTKHQNEEGKWVWQSVVYDEPWLDFPATGNQATGSRVDDPDVAEKPWPDYPATEKPSTENQAKVSTDRASTDGVSTERERKSKAAAALSDKETAAVWQAWTDNMPGTITPMITDAVHELLREYSAREIVRAIGIAVERNKRTLGYVRGCLQRGVDVAPAHTEKPKSEHYITDPVTGERKRVYA